MGTEIERKFRVNLEELRRKHPTLPAGRLFEQGYFCHDPAIRIRVEGPVEGPWPLKAALTIKGPGLAKRPEFPFPVALDDTEALLALCKSKLQKIRYDIHFGADHWEVDEFLREHHGLWLAEIELKSLEQCFDRPSWLGREVTNDSRYQNVYLAEHCGRFWDESDWR
jgi:adenylate cyclase